MQTFATWHKSPPRRQRQPARRPQRTDEYHEPASEPKGFTDELDKLDF